MVLWDKMTFILPLNTFRLSSAMIISLIIAGAGYKKQSLNLSGAVAGFFVGVILTYSSYAFFAGLFTFFVTGSVLTKLKAKRKQQMDAEYQQGARRNWMQVVANAGVATVGCFIFLMNLPSSAENHEILLDLRTQPQCSLLAISILAVLAGSAGDTWASEVGSVYSSSSPRLITTWRTVPPGTNGGFTVLGTLASCVGGLCVGVSHYLALVMCNWRTGAAVWRQWPICFIGLLAGFTASTVDSFIGATLQYSGFDEETGKIVNHPQQGVKHISGWNLLNNNHVNLLSSFITAFIVPALCYVTWEYCS